MTDDNPTPKQVDTNDEWRKKAERIAARFINRQQWAGSTNRIRIELSEIIVALLQDVNRASHCDINKLGTWVFVGDEKKIKNLDDLYWSYVAEKVATDTAHYDNYKLDYLKKNMKYASFHSVGVHKLLARADQYARERIAALQPKEKTVTLDKTYSKKEPNINHEDFEEHSS